MERDAQLLAEIKDEFPDFAIVPKSGDALQRAIAVALAILTFGGQRAYLTRYHTVLFGRLYVPTAWTRMTADERYVLLRHERVHLRQRQRLGDIFMAFVYLFPILPLFLAWGRARLEWEAYLETIRATREVFGPKAAGALRTELIRRYVGPDYGWMWPFPRQVGRWFDEALAEVEAEDGLEGPRSV